MTSVLTGLGLSAAAGLNAWVVLLLFHGLVRLLPQDFLGPTTALLSSRTALTTALVLFVAEFVVDKIPVVDRLWDAAHTLLRPAVGALLMLAAVPAASFGEQAAAGAAGAVVTLATHLAKTTTRLTSTAATRGFAQFVLSLAEDVVAVALGALVFFVPGFAGLFLLALAIVLVLHRERVARALRVLFFRLSHPRRALRQI